MMFEGWVSNKDLNSTDLTWHSGSFLCRSGGGEVELK